MSHSITLYQYETTDIKVDIVARFDGESLIIDGYDIGERVKEYWGDSDYEYLITIPPASVIQLYEVLSVRSGDRLSLLQELSNRYHTKTYFSEIRKLLDDHHIASEGFSWT